MAIAVALFFLAISCLQLYIVVGSKNTNVRRTAGIFTGISVLFNLIATTGVLFEAIFVILIFPASLFLIVANVKYRSHCNDCGVAVREFSRIKNLYTYCENCASKNLYE